ncbi:MAG: hypothetical protein LBE12_03350 [Planctomycetaceae bacterium]|nr:hypothetical protein [Planctomycetaceae bacterium]
MLHKQTPHGARLSPQQSSLALARLWGSFGEVLGKWKIPAPAVAIHTPSRVKKEK